MQSAVQLGQQYGRYVMQLTSELLQPEQPPSLSDMECGIRTMLLKQGRFLLGAWLAMVEEDISCDLHPLFLWGPSRVPIPARRHIADHLGPGHL
jgi:hypothetical protein